MSDQLKEFSTGGLHGGVVRVGVEGTGSYSAGLARYLTAAPRRQLGQRPRVKLPQFPNLVTAPLSASGCCWWPTARLPRPAPRPLTRSTL